MDYTGDADKIISDMKRLEDENKVILYLDKLWDIETGKNVMRMFMDEKWLDEIIELDEDIPWSVYLMKNSEQ